MGYGDGGLGTAWSNVPDRDLTVIVLTQRAAGGDPGRVRGRAQGCGQTQFATSGASSPCSRV